MLKANILRYCGKEYYDAKAEDALHKGKRIDTMMKTIKFVSRIVSEWQTGKIPQIGGIICKVVPRRNIPWRTTHTGR